MNQAILNKISQYFDSQPVERAWIFGSYVRSEENSQSDIDILVNFIPGEKITLLKYVHMVNELQALTGRKIDMVEDGQLKKFAERSVQNEKILIYERKAKG
jgi:uncharacterized protein